jgi:UMP-CMP kinase
MFSTVSTKCASPTKDSSAPFVHRSILQQQLKPKVLFFLGGPGAGKGTQCEKLSSEFGMKHLSAGELLREERMSGSANGQLIESYLKEGKIVPVKITLDLLRQRMEHEKDTNRFLVDGFPRNWDNVQGWESCMGDVCDVEAVIFLDCPEAELEKRLLSRGKTSGRSDDNIETARKRFATFKEATLPVVEHYQSMNKLIKIGGDQPVEQVFKGLKGAVVPFIEQEIKQLTQILLDAISEGDWDTYKKLCDPSLTAFEGESKVSSLAIYL